PPRFIVPRPGAELSALEASFLVFPSFLHCAPSLPRFLVNLYVLQTLLVFQLVATLVHFYPKRVGPMILT
ncbi:hypothetical protein BD779DRAFT_1503473, partial [Infundibulicybe gibba]